MFNRTSDCYYAILQIKQYNSVFVILILNTVVYYETSCAYMYHLANHD